MSTKFLKLFLREYLHQLIGFSYALSGDIRKGEEVITDSILAYSIETDLSGFSEEKVRDVLKDISKLIYCRFNSRRYIEVEEKLSGKSEEGKFFLLSDIERAICFLKYRMHLEIDEMSKILDLKSNEIISILNSAKNFLTEDNFKNSVGHAFEKQM